jgi:hypothetical protein
MAAHTSPCFYLCPQRLCFFLSPREDGMHCTFLTFSTDQEFFKRFGFALGNLCQAFVVVSICCWLISCRVCIPTMIQITVVFFGVCKKNRRGYLQPNSSIMSLLCHQQYFRVKKQTRSLLLLIKK